LWTWAVLAAAILACSFFGIPARIYSPTLALALQPFLGHWMSFALAPRLAVIALVVSAANGSVISTLRAG
jgi:hypothetical protein